MIRKLYKHGKPVQTCSKKVSRVDIRSKQENENSSEKFDEPNGFHRDQKMQKVHCVTLQSACSCPPLLYRLHFPKNYSLENFLPNALLLPRLENNATFSDVLDIDATKQILEFLIEIFNVDFTSANVALSFEKSWTVLK